MTQKFVNFLICDFFSDLKSQFSKKLKDMKVKVSTIARGVSFGGELEYADELTLGRSIVARVPYRINE